MFKKQGYPIQRNGKVENWEACKPERVRLVSVFVLCYNNYVHAEPHSLIMLDNHESIILNEFSN